MDWEKASDEMSEALGHAAELIPRVEKRKMFGGLSLFLNGNMFAGVHGRKIVVRLGEHERSRLVAEAGAIPFEPAPGRVMQEYIVVPEVVLTRPEALAEWLGLSVDYVGGLPPKAPKAKRKRTSAGS